jgi:hypothetical protein
MMGENHYLMSALPSTGELGTAPPVSARQLLEHVSINTDVTTLLEALFLLDDLVQREAFLAGEIQKVEPIVLTQDQARNEAPLPEYLAGEEDEEKSRSVDDLWDRAFHHVADVARRQGSDFLLSWVRHEVSLRNAFARARAKALELDEINFVVAVDLNDPDVDFEGLINEWSSARTPLDGYRVLLRARWEWIGAHDSWFKFSDDELVAYAAKIMLLDQWYRLAEEGPAAEEASEA